MIFKHLLFISFFCYVNFLLLVFNHDVELNFISQLHTVHKEYLMKLIHVLLVDDLGINHKRLLRVRHHVKSFNDICHLPVDFGAIFHFQSDEPPRFSLRLLDLILR